MPEQFQYPDTGWSTGKMRKNGTLLGAGEEPQQAGFEPDKLSDDELKQYYEDTFQQNRPAMLHGSEREFNIYMDVLKNRQRKTGEDMYQMSPKQLKEMGVGQKNQEQMPKGPRGVW